MKLNIKANKIKCKELNEGDLFSTADQDYWNKVNNNEHKSLGEKVYIRTIEPCPTDQEEEDIYRLSIYHF
jgi:hypothetical protein